METGEALVHQRLSLANDYRTQTTTQQADYILRGVCKNTLNKMFTYMQTNRHIHTYIHKTHIDINIIHTCIYTNASITHIHVCIQAYMDAYIIYTYAFRNIYIYIYTYIYIYIIYCIVLYKL